MIKLNIHLQDQQVVTVQVSEAMLDSLKGVKGIIDENNQSESIIYGNDKTVCLPRKQIVYIDYRPESKQKPEPKPKKSTLVPLHKQSTDDKPDVPDINDPIF